MHGLKLGSQGNRRMYSAKNALLQGTEVKYRGQRLDNNEERIVDCCKFRETLEEITIIIPVVTRAFREEVLGKSNSTWEAEDKCRYLSQPQACNRESHQAIVFPSRFIYLLAIYPSQYSSKWLFLLMTCSLFAVLSKKQDVCLSKTWLSWLCLLSQKQAES